jgi:hypothetical protein
MNRQRQSTSVNSETKALKRHSLAWLLIASLTSTSVAPAYAADAHASRCDSLVYWSKKSPNEALIIKQNRDRIYFLKCSLELEMEHDKAGNVTAQRRISGCNPLEADHPSYTESELNKDWLALVKEQLLSRSLEAAFTFILTVSVVGVMQEAAGLVSVASRWTLGKAAQIGRVAYRATSGLFRSVGIGENIIAGSEVVAKDRALPAVAGYIGSGGTIVGGMAKDFAHAKTNGDLAKVLAIAPQKRSPATGISDFMVQPCSVELTQFAKMSVDEYAKLIKQGLSDARKLVDNPSVYAGNGPKTQEQRAVEKALTTPPTGSVDASMLPAR